MNKEETIDKIDSLIDRVIQTQYILCGNFFYHKHDAIMLLPEDIPDRTGLIKRIQSIKFRTQPLAIPTSDNTDEQLFNYQKECLIEILNEVKNFIIESPAPQHGNQVKNEKQNLSSKNIFIVHGHNDVMKLAVERIINKLGLNPIILNEQTSEGRTIIEKFEDLTENIRFAIILLSADDQMENGQFRARQNVILEFGYFIAKLGRSNVAILYENSESKQIELPSDVQGMIYIPYDNPNGTWIAKILKELQAVGFDVDANEVI